MSRCPARRRTCDRRACSFFAVISGPAIPQEGESANALLGLDRARGHQHAQIWRHRADSSAVRASPAIDMIDGGLETSSCAIAGWPKRSLRGVDLGRGQVLSFNIAEASQRSIRSRPCRWPTATTRPRFSATARRNAAWNSASGSTIDRQAFRIADIGMLTRR